MDFNILFILECFYYKEDKEFFSMFTVPSMKDFNISTAYQWLRKNEYLVEDPNDISKWIISVKGTNFMEQVLLDDPKLVGENMSASTIIVDYGKSPDECFEEWWKLYPGTTAWTTDDKQTKFIGSRNLKNLRKPAAKARYLKLLNQGFKHDDLIGVLAYEMKLKKLDSIKKNQNQMEYFKGMEAYLNQETYMTFMEQYKQNPGIVKAEDLKGKKKNVTDI